MKRSMEQADLLFLKLFRAALKGEKADPGQEVTDAQWKRIFDLAAAHHVLPMIYEAASPAQVPGVMRYKHAALQMVMLQAQKTCAFLEVYQALREAQLHPLVVKGIVCRSLYPKPDLRLSTDEDLLIPQQEVLRCRQVLQEQGLTPAGQQADPEAEYEIPYTRSGSMVYIELHKSLFPPEGEAYGEWNRFFAAVHERPEELTIDGTTLLTMQPTDHLFYLICHAFKHFLHSGVGIRQAADIALFANRYGSRVDWQYILEGCRQIHAEKFTAALLRIGEKYLTFDPDKADYPEVWRRIHVDERALLMDLIDAGVYGSSSMSRRHSSTMTLHAVAAEKKGKSGTGGADSALHSVFPPAAELKSRYPYLRKYPWLLPAAWASRIAGYLRETAAGKQDNNAAASLRIGERRIELLREYGVLEGENRRR